MKGRKRKYFFNEGEIIGLHLNKGKSIEEISKDFNVCSQVIRNIFTRNNLNINKRSTNTIKKLKESKTLKLDENEIIRLYTQENKSIDQISKQFNVCFSVIKSRLVNNNIKIRDKKFTEGGLQKLRDLYLNKTIDELYGEEKANNIRKKLSKISKGIPKTPEHNLKNRLANLGEKSHNWLGGKSFEPYTKEFNKMFKLAIKQRDGFMCLKCGMREEDAKILLNKILAIHHIDYIKANTFKENCCALCLRCNTEVNKDRKSWTKFFQSLLAERYGYKYSEIGEIIINIGGIKNEIK